MKFKKKCYQTREEELKNLWIGNAELRAQRSELQAELWEQEKEEIHLRQKAYELAEGHSVQSRIEVAEKIFLYLTGQRNNPAEEA